MTRFILALVLAAGIGLLAWLAPARAQTPAPPDTVEVRLDAPLPLPNDEPRLGDGARPAAEGRERPVSFAARDSLVIVFADEADPQGDVATLFGNARTVYDDAQLTAGQIELLLQREILRARGPSDEAGGESRPTFQRGTDVVTGRELAYEMATGRGRVVGARTVLQDGFIHGGVVLQDGPRVTYAQDVIYTTCDREEHAHWGIHTHRMKVVDGEWVYTGAARLHLLGIPTPLWLPFGFFPAFEGRRSGPLPPQYGEQADLGFFLRNVGYYWAISDFMDVQLAGGLYTTGSHEADATFRYARRYWYDGALQLGYRLERRGEPQDPDYRTQRQFNVMWRHNQILDATGQTRLSGNVNLRSSGFARSLAADYDLRVNQQTTSSINLTRRWPGGRNLSVAYRQNLNLHDGATHLTLPQIAFNQPRWFPFRAGPGGARGPLDQISLQYTSSLQNIYRFPAAADTSDVTWLEGLLSAEAFRRATGLDQRFDMRATHHIPLSGQVSITELPLLGSLQLDLSPSLAYREEWLSSRRELRLGDDGFAARDTLGNLQFDQRTAFTAIRQADLTVSAATRIFGTFPWRVGALDGFRHEIQPMVAFRFAPDYSAPFWGRMARHVEPDGTVIEYPVHAGFGVPGRPQQSLDFSINNLFLTRLAREDDAGAVQRRHLTLLNLNLSGGYDLAADSLAWRDLHIHARSTIAEQVSVNVSATYSPYAVNAFGVPQNRFYFAETGRPLRLLRATLNASTSLRGGRGAAAPEIAAPRQRPLDVIGGDGLLPHDHRRPDLGFVDFSIPWSLALDFNWGMSRTFTGADPSVHATLNGTFDLGLTPNWRISGRSGFDIQNGRFVPTQISVLRDLHCWEMSINWLPFGDVRAFSFSIYVKSGHLRDILRLDVPHVDRTRHF